MNAPATLDHAGIAARIPHRAPMCLLDRLLSWNAQEIVCVASDHTDPAHPLRLAGMLSTACALEYVSQAMALHGALCAPARDAPTPGFLASARGVQLHVRRLDDAPAPLRVRAQRLAGDASQALYAFELRDARERVLASGRATAMFGTALAVPPERSP
ncbi:MAG: hydroxymyristoyl-ACP dehydratase [Ideonella sp.]|nr:MAG: hydroxymyristoyl-ACP dehydratase [Burkholderiaceae bacterium]MBE7426907.1 hydroxymyristoyl-ACP dehydratase [Ideonella sp.]